MIIQLCGLSASGKTTLSKSVQILLMKKKIITEIIDGDELAKKMGCGCVFIITACWKIRRCTNTIMLWAHALAGTVTVIYLIQQNMNTTEAAWLFHGSIMASFLPAGRQSVGHKMNGKWQYFNEGNSIFLSNTNLIMQM